MLTHAQPRPLVLLEPCQCRYAVAVTADGTFLFCAAVTETRAAALPLVIMPEPPPPPARSFARPARIRVNQYWRVREGFEQACGQLFRSHGSTDEWQVSLRPSQWGHVAYLRTFPLPSAVGGPDEPFTPIGALNGSRRERGNDDYDFIWVDIGEDGAGSYVPEILFIPTMTAAKQLALKCAWQYLRPLPQQHPPPLSFRWMRIRP